MFNKKLVLEIYNLKNNSICEYLKPTHGSTSASSPTWINQVNLHTPSIERKQATSLPTRAGMWTVSRDLSACSLPVTVRALSIPLTLVIINAIDTNCNRTAF